MLRLLLVNVITTATTKFTTFTNSTNTATKPIASTVSKNEYHSLAPRRYVLQLSERIFQMIFKPEFYRRNLGSR
jgi:hypothetical protein